MVKAGETVLITEHDEVVAEIRPAHRQNVSGDFNDLLFQLSEKGEASLATESLSGWKGFSEKLKGLVPAGNDLIDELRRDSR